MTDHAEQLTLPPPRTYTRTDFAALRAWVQRVPLPTIACLYFDAATTPYHDDPAPLERHLRAMRDDRPPHGAARLTGAGRPPEGVPSASTAARS